VSDNDRVTLTKKELKRLDVLSQVGAERLTVPEAAQALGLSQRQVQRLKAAHREEGAAALVHGNRGRSPKHAISSELRAQTIELARTTYFGFNYQHLSEALAERDEPIVLSHSSVRRILQEEGIKSPRKRRAPKHRSRRERRPQAGMLIQIDGSRHDWLEGRGPYLTLVGAIDDATGEVPYGLFRCQEDAQGYFLLMRQVVTTKGIPLAVYSDKHGIFRRNLKEPETIREQLAGRREPTQFGRLMEELLIEVIFADSPQAKGRIERLWGTFQDRLVSELRRAGAKTLPEANAVLWAFLPRFNAHFAQPPAQTESAYRALPNGLDLQRVFCFKYYRTVANDNTVTLEERRVEIPAGTDRVSYARAKVEVQERLDGSLAVYHGERQIASASALGHPDGSPDLRLRRRHRVDS
jgi:transposase